MLRDLFLLGLFGFFLNYLEHTLPTETVFLASLEIVSIS